MAPRHAVQIYSSFDKVPDRLRKVALILPAVGATAPPWMRQIPCDLYAPSGVSPDAERILGAVLFNAGDAVPDGVEKVAATASTVGDTFTRADSATTLGNAETGGAWSAVTGTWGISSDKAYLALGSGSNNVAVVDSGASDVIVDVTFSTYAPDALAQRLIVRETDASNYLLVTNQDAGGNVGNNVSIWKNIAGVFTNLAVTAHAWADGDVVRVVAIGSSLFVYVNGTQLISTSSTANQTATKHGIGGGTKTGRFDNFQVRTGMTS